jgi:hypothetical protein
MALAGVQPPFAPVPMTIAIASKEATDPPWNGPI